MKNILLVVSILIGSVLFMTMERFSVEAAPAQQVGAPTLLWQRGGCYSSWCETGWYSSPAVADLDGNGAMEVIGGAYKIFILNGANGSVQKSIDTPGSRVWPGVVVADLDANGDLEIVTAQGDGYLNVLDHTGEVVWSVRPVENELRGLSVYDLDNDNTMEIIVTSARGSKTNTWVYEHNGALRSGWPQLNNDTGYAWGVFNSNAAIGDLDDDGQGEIVVPSDVHYVCAYEANGVQLPVNSIYTGRQYWGQVGVHVDNAVDIRGYAHCGSEHRPNFAHTPALVVDVTGDGSQEAVVMGNVYNCGTDPYTSLYEMPFIFNANRTRWSGNGHDWTAIPAPEGSAGPISEDYDVIESNMSNPVAADLDSNGEMEVLYSSYDGRMHVYWLDKTEHGNWPYRVYTGSGSLRFASEPVVADLDNNGYAEVIFASWVQKGTNQTGKLHILDYLGNVLQEVNLPAPYGSANWNGALAAPTLANIDNDPNLEVVLNTAHSGFVAYRLPNTGNARILWGTGRGNYQRTGSILVGSLYASTKRVTPTLPDPGDVLTYTIELKNPGPELSNVLVTDTLPSEVNYLGNLSASSGTYGVSGRVITWTGAVPGGAPVTISYGVTVSLEITQPHAIVNAASIDDQRGNVLLRQATTIVNGVACYLPLILKN